MGQWSGDDWQAYCDELLAARHGADYQRIPDILGDYGAEGFVAGGTFVQAYAAEEVVEAKKLYDAQRNKITRDLAKIKKNRVYLSSLSGCAIKRVIFLVPEVRTKDLLVHCATKAKEVRDSDLQEFAPDFDIRVLTGDDFPEERRRIGENIGIALGLAPSHVSDAAVDSWASSNSELAANLARKLDDLVMLSSDQRRHLGTTLIRMYLRRADVLRQLRQSYPRLWEAVQMEVSGREQVLVAENLLAQAPAQSRITDLAAEIEERLVEGAPGMRANGPELGWGTVAEWLLRCPLELNGLVAT